MGQKLSSFSESQLIDSLWNVVNRSPEIGQEIANELLRRNKVSPSYKALINGLQGTAEYLIQNGQLDSCMVIYHQAQELALKQGDRREQSFVLSSMSFVSERLNEFDKAIDFRQQSIKLWEELGDTAQLCDSWLRYANQELMRDRHDEAMRLFVSSLEYCENINDQISVAYAHLGMSTIHKKQKNLEKAVDVANKAVRIIEQENNDFELFGALNNRGVLMKDIGNYEAARKDYERGLAIALKFGSEYYPFSFYTNLAILENLEGKPKLALELCGKAIPIAITTKQHQPYSDLLNESAKAHLKLGQVSAALDSSRKSIHFAQMSSSLEKELAAWETLSSVHQARAEYDSALIALRMHRQLSDSMFIEKKTAEIDRLQVVYDTGKKEQEIKSLQMESQMAQNRNRWLLIGLLGMTVGAIAVVLAITQKRRKDRALHASQLKIADMERLRLEEQLDYKQRELTGQALHLAQKNEILNALKQDLSDLQLKVDSPEVTNVTNKIRIDEQIDRNWEQFLKVFTETKTGFFSRLQNQHPDLSAGDQRLAALLSMSLTSKEIASVLNISDAGVKKARYRLRKKLNINTEEKLPNYLASY